jgi:hypothetical protein
MLADESLYVVPSTPLFSTSTGMQPQWRETIAQWYIQIAQTYQVPNHTVAVALNYFDRCVLANKGASVDLHLLALTCLTIASKFFEPRPITIAEAQNIVQLRYDQKAIVATEQRVLQLLDWKLNSITSYEILTTLLLFDPNRDELTAHAELFLLISLSEGTFIDFPPSVLGMASILCAYDNAGLSPEAWVDWLSCMTALPAAVGPCVELMMSSMVRLAVPPPTPCENLEFSHKAARSCSPVNVSDIAALHEEEPSTSFACFESLADHEPDHAPGFVSDFF